MTGRDRMIILVLGIGAILAGFWFGLVSPRRAEAGRVTAQLTQARQARDTALQAFESASAAKKAARSAAAEIARLGQAVPPDDETASLVYQLQSAAGRSRVSFDSLVLDGAGSAPAGTAPTTTGAAAAPLPPGAVPGPAGVSKLPFTLTFQGTYFGLERFLKRVHAFTSFRGDVLSVRGRLLQIDGVALKAASSGFPHIEADLTASAYLAAPVGQATGATATPATGAVTPPATPTATAAPPTAPAAITGVGR